MPSQLANTRYVNGARLPGVNFANLRWVVNRGLSSSVSVYAFPNGLEYDP